MCKLQKKKIKNLGLIPKISNEEFDKCEICLEAKICQKAI